MGHPRPTPHTLPRGSRSPRPSNPPPPYSVPKRSTGTPRPRQSCSPLHRPASPVVADVLKWFPGTPSTRPPVPSLPDPYQEATDGTPEDVHGSDLDTGPPGPRTGGSPTSTHPTLTMVRIQRGFPCPGNRGLFSSHRPPVTVVSIHTEATHTTPPID